MRNDLQLNVMIPGCDSCGRPADHYTTLHFNDEQVKILHYVGMYTGHPANYWHGMSATDAAKELHRLKAAVLKKPLQCMELVMRENRYAYTDLILGLNDQIPKLEGLTKGYIEVPR